MWARIERRVDGMVGRMLSLLTLPPVRLVQEKAEPAVAAAKRIAAKPAVVRVRGTAEKAVEATEPSKRGAKKRVAKRKVTRKSAARKSAARKPSAKQPAAKKEETTERIEAFVASAERPVSEGVDDVNGGADAALEGVDEKLDLFVAGIERSSGIGAELEKRVLVALAAAAQGASLTELQRRTGAKPAALGSELKRLSAAGRVEIKMHGMTKRYYAEGSQP